MTIKVQPARIIGGPLNGQSYPVGTKWPSYLDEAGNTLPVGKGDRIMRGRPHSGFPKTCYIFRINPETKERTYEYIGS